MELIKKIKESEAQAQEIIEQAGIQATKHAEKCRENWQHAMIDAEQQNQIASRKATPGIAR